MNEPLLKIRDLKIAFDTRHGVLKAVDGISFDIAPGEVFGVVGESGACKSLTGQAIIGLLEPPGRISGGILPESWKQCGGNGLFPEPAGMSGEFGPR